MGSDCQWGQDFFGGNESVLTVIVVIDAQLCDYANNREIVHFKWIIV